MPTDLTGLFILQIIRASRRQHVEEIQDFFNGMTVAMAKSGIQIIVEGHSEGGENGHTCSYLHCVCRAEFNVDRFGGSNAA